MRINPILTTLAAVVVLAALLGAAALFLQPAGPVLESAEFSLDSISPNADGKEDVLRITYRLRRPANVSIYFIGEDDAHYSFRTDNPRDSGEHSLLFSGIVDAFHLPDDTNEATILNRVLQNGDYTWVVDARDSGGEATQIKGTLHVVDADPALP